MGFYPAVLLRATGSSIGSFEFKSVIAWRVMTGRDHNTAISAQFAHGVRKGRGWNIGAAKIHAHFVSCKDLGYFPGIPIRQKAGVETHYRDWSILALMKVISNGLSH